jgi:hypothetical protein
MKVDMGTYGNHDRGAKGKAKEMIYCMITLPGSDPVDSAMIAKVYGEIAPSSLVVPRKVELRPIFLPRTEYAICVNRIFTRVARHWNGRDRYSDRVFYAERPENMPMTRWKQAARSLKADGIRTGDLK